MAAAPKVAFVTGGARGLGRAIALDLARDHRVALTYCNTAPGDLPEGVFAVRCDLTGPGAAQTAIAAVMAQFGALDVLVNNAGALAPAPPDAFPQDDLRAMLDVNLLAPQALLAAALPHLTEGASVVSLSSVNAVLPPMGAALYGASKAALNTWTRGMAKELGPRGIRVNAVAPGAVNTPEAPRDPELTAKFTEMTALGALAEPADIAAAVRFLVSDAARRITGEVLTVSGGYRL